MINNYRGQIVHGRWKPRNCILGDEMGLGKTAQSIAVMSWLKQYAGASAPCMVVAPLTTLGHWKREIETWTDLVRGCWVEGEGGWQRTAIAAARQR